MFVVRSVGALALVACAKATSPADAGAPLASEPDAAPPVTPPAAGCENVVASFPLTRKRNDVDGSLVLVTCAGASRSDDARGALEIRTALGAVRDRYSLLGDDLSAHAEDLRGNGDPVIFTTARVAYDGGVGTLTRVWHVDDGHVDAVHVTVGGKHLEIVPVVLYNSPTADWRLVTRGRHKDILWWHRKPAGRSFFEDQFGRIAFDGEGYSSPTTETTSSDESFGLRPGDAGEPEWLSKVPPAP